MNHKLLIVCTSLLQTGLLQAQEPSLLDALGEVTSESGDVKVQLTAGNEMGGVSCEMETGNMSAPVPGSRGFLQGIGTGYLMDVVLNRCVEVQK